MQLNVLQGKELEIALILAFSDINVLNLKNILLFSKNTGFLKLISKQASEII